MEKIIYLDYDGVMHDDAVYWHSTRGIYLDTPGRILFEWMPTLKGLLAPYTDVSIVLSTSWVRAKNFEFAKNKLSTQGRE
ncbi:HAD domain-containing protein [Undibacterium sp.]|uniref:HAD domain-containing protein n=1 Tax=Undibacterium sp. TaxID=1914977 RepID=UPI0025F2ED1B|nr:HAD domain-containing protein [Undibacterium sp.]